MSQDTLFEIGGPREFHESETQQQEALAILRHRKLTKTSFERDWHREGARLAPAIDRLRNGWGFEIAGSGTERDPYWLLNPNQSPTKVNDNRISKLYYESQHWIELRERRWAFDNYRCVLCVNSCRRKIQCHHITYNLFCEQLDELMTVCEYHHDLIHDKKRGCKLAFPIGVDLWIAERLLGVVAYPFPEWLLP